MDSKTIYAFFCPKPVTEVTEFIRQAMLTVGIVKIADARRGYVLGAYRVSRFRTIKMEFYIERNPSACKIRAIFHGSVLMSVKDKWWDDFLNALFAVAPGVDFGVNVSYGKPLVCGVQFLEGETQQVYYSHTSGGTSLAGFMLGGLLFGEAGAIVGGFSGSKHTTGSVRTEFMTRQLVKVIYDNGRMWEGRVKKDSPLYNELILL